MKKIVIGTSLAISLVLGNEGFVISDNPNVQEKRFNDEVKKQFKKTLGNPHKTVNTKECKSYENKINTSIKKSNAAIDFEDRKSAIKFITEAKETLYIMIGRCKDTVLYEHKENILDVDKRIKKIGTTVLIKNVKK